MISHKEIVCPYCIRILDPKSANYRCPNYNRGRAECGELIKRNSRAKATTCEGCYRPVVQPVCQYCKEDIPAQYLTNKRFLIALIGPTGSGKSTYLAVLIKELRSRLGEALNVTLTPCDDVTSRRYTSELIDPLYGRSAVLEHNQPLAKYSDHRPFVFELSRTPRTKSWKLFVRRNTDSAIVVFFDSAGEDVEFTGDIDVYLRYLQYADGIIFMIDPIQIPEAASDCAPRNSLFRDAAPPRVAREVLEATTHTIRKQRQIRREKKLPVAAAVVVSKADELDDTIVQRSPLLQSNSTSSEFDVNDRANVHEFVRALLSRWNVALDLYLDDNYKSYGLFALSALGTRPRGTGLSPTGIHPNRLADPMLWLMKSLRILGGY